jgi:predicted acetyltransferase
MTMSTLILRQLSADDEDEFLAAVVSFKEVDPDWEFAFETENLFNFKRYVEIVNSWKEGKNLKEGFVPNSYLLALVDGTIVGRSSIRHELNEQLKLVNGHIGYGVLPAHRKKGYAKAILSQSITYLKNLGVSDILITCDEDNLASMRTIEASGGVLENKVNTPGSDKKTCRYWVR